jgi:hypothetical protein
MALIFWCERLSLTADLNKLSKKLFYLISFTRSQRFDRLQLLLIDDCGLTKTLKS